MPRSPLLLLVFLSAACSSSASLTGVGAFDPNTQTAQGLGTLYSDGGGLFNQLNVLVARIDQGAQDCAQITMPGNPSTGQLLRISLFHADGSEMTTGTYEIGSPDAGNIAILFTLLREPDAGSAPTAAGVSGSVTLSQIQPNTVATFNAQMATADDGGGSLSGNVNAAFCGVQFE
jgi:hypothetical protein